ncbi:MAG: hypothetical protein R2731_09255 [Nocardioides sp.]
MTGRHGGSLRRAGTGALGRALGVFVVTVAALAAFSVLAEDVVVAIPVAPRRLRPPVRHTPTGCELLVVRHHCWTGAAPDPDAIPGHAIVTLPGRRPELADSSVGFAIWLEGAPGHVHAFCP